MLYRLPLPDPILLLAICGIGNKAIKLPQPCYLFDRESLISYFAGLAI